MSSEAEPSSPKDVPEPGNNDIFADNVVSMRDYLDREIALRQGHQQRAKDGELIVRVKDKLEKHKKITIVGTAAAIGLALGGLYAVRKKRKR